MKKMWTKILKKVAILPLVFILAAAPLLCCCFTGAAWAGAKTSLETSSKGCPHCDKQKKTSSQSQAHECDCPYVLAENASLKFAHMGFPSAFPESLFGPGLTAGAWTTENRLAVLVKPDKHHGISHKQSLPPAFLLYHNFRI